MQFFILIYFLNDVDKFLYLYKLKFVIFNYVLSEYIYIYIYHCTYWESYDIVTLDISKYWELLFFSEFIQVVIAHVFIENYRKLLSL